MWTNLSLRPVWLLICGCALLAGCGDGEQIRRYRVPEADLETATDLAPRTSVSPRERETYAARMLAAMMPQGDQTWFFKLLGPDEAVAAHETAFRDFLHSIRFVDGKPAWTLPEGWRERPGADMRYATLLVGEDDPPLELSVIGFGTVGEYGDDYILLNVNRWRHDQLGLERITLAELPDETEQIEIDGVTATVVSLQGRAVVSDGPSRPPFAGGAF